MTKDANWKRVARRILCAAILLSTVAWGQEYEKAKTFDKTADQVVDAAEAIIAKHQLGTVIERDRQHHVLRLRLRSFQGRMQENFSGRYAVLTLEPNSTSKTVARLAVGSVNTATQIWLPSTSKTVDPQDSKFAAKFLKLLEEELRK
jgi:hypothetical protein